MNEMSEWKKKKNDGGMNDEQTNEWKHENE